MLKKNLFFVLIILPLFLSAQTDVRFDDYFVDKTLRIDYYHSGNATEELFTIDKIYEYGVWAGNPSRLLDQFNNGKYYVKIYDTSTNKLIFSKGYSSYFGEYQTTQPALDGIKRTYHETVLIPRPRNNFLLVIEVRDKKNILHSRFKQEINPDDYHIIREAANASYKPVISRRRTTNKWKPQPVIARSGTTKQSLEDSAGIASASQTSGSLAMTESLSYKVIKELDNGHPHEKVDVVFIAEGYRQEEYDVFRRDLKERVALLFSVKPYSLNKERFNVYGVFAPSQESGVDEPRKGIYKNTVLNSSFNALDLPRYLLTEDNRALHELAAAVPYDAIFIMINSERYGGGGIYNHYAVFTAHSPATELVFVHEFGHSFAGLADEYYASNVAYNDFYPQGVEPTEPNITALLDSTELKWENEVNPGKALPSEWNKIYYDSLSVHRQELRRRLQNLEFKKATGDSILILKNRMKEIKKKQKDFIANHPLKNKVGFFEGAGYASKGLYRPMLNCMMFSNQEKKFCRVCERAIQRMIDFYSTK